MSLLRNSTVKQMDRIEAEIKKNGGQFDLSCPSEKTMANGMWIHDPFDANRKGTRKLSTIEDHIKIDIPDSNENVIKFDKFNEKTNLNMNTVKKFNDFNVNEGHGEDKKTRVFYDVVLPGYEYDETTATEWAQGFDWSQSESEEQSLSYMRYVDTINGIDVWYCYGSDDYLFSEEEVQEDEEIEQQAAYIKKRGEFFDEMEDNN